MIAKFTLLSQLIKNMGWRYLIFRIKHEILTRTGLFKLKFPTQKKIEINILYQDWLKNKVPFLIDDKNSIQIDKALDEKTRIEAEKILNGEIKFFNNEFLFLGKNYNWITNPDSNFVYDIKKHFSDINDYSKQAGDIKFIWEKSRFSYIYTLLRDEIINGNNHQEFIFNEIESWIDNNPVNQGPNWKCSQETSLRVLNWVYALYFYSNNSMLSESKWQKIIQSIYWQVHHVYGNIHFSRIAVRNNHAITETLTLYIIGTLFPFLPNANTWKAKGKNWFEQEIEYQVYEDGSFLQFSMNYNRVVVQLLSWAISFANANNERFKEVVYKRAYATLNFLYQCQEGKNGELPNYGSNDGALFFPFGANAFRDYRPQLNSLHKILTSENLYQNNIKDEVNDAAWYANSFNSNLQFQPLKKQYGVVEFKVGGYYLFRDEVSLTFIRCGNHKDRPHQADNLHVDIWVNGENILVDGGSYKYNSTNDDNNYFFGTSSHNTLMLNNSNQMQKGNRFIWLYWTQCKSVICNVNNQGFQFNGSISAFETEGENILHKRNIAKKQNELVWLVEDEIVNAKEPLNLTQNWLLHPKMDKEKIEILNEDQNVLETQKTAFYSSEYGSKQETKQIQFATNHNQLKTTIRILD